MRKFTIDSDYTVATSNAIFEVTQPCTITYSPSGNDTGNTIKNVSGGNVTLQTASVALGEERDTIDGVYEITISSDSNITIYEVAQGVYESVSGPNSQKMENISASVDNIEETYILSEMYENEIGSLDSETYNDLSASSSVTDGVVSITSTETYGTSYLVFEEDLADRIGNTLLVTAKVTAITAGDLKMNVYKYEDGVNLGNVSGDSYSFEAGETKRLSVLLSIDEEMNKLRCGPIGIIGDFQYEEMMIIDVTDDLDFDPDSILDGYWIGNPPYNVVKILYETVTVSKWDGLEALVLGDSLTAAGVWQQKLNTVLGMNVTTHALGGIGLATTVEGNESIDALSVADVTGKHLIIVFAGYNDRYSLKGDIGDLYPTNSTFAGKLQYVINTIYDLLEQADNLSCKIAVITPHCVGKYSYIEYDGYDEFPVDSGQTLQDVCKTMEEVANYNSIKCYNAWENSGINKFTWSEYSASDTAETDGSVNDQLHLNSDVGYPHLGDRIAAFVETV